MLQSKPPDFYRWGNRDPERKGPLPNITGWIGGEKYHTLTLVLAAFQKLSWTFTCFSPCHFPGTLSLGLVSEAP